jgi:hypothetical protein
MNITPITADVGLQATATKLTESSNRFDELAAQVVQDTSPADTATPDSSNLAGDMVSMKEQSLLNSMLAGVFHRQSEQQNDLTKMLGG